MTFAEHPSPVPSELEVFLVTTLSPMTPLSSGIIMPPPTVKEMARRARGRSRTARRHPGCQHSGWTPCRLSRPPARRRRKSSAREHGDRHGRRERRRGARRSSWSRGGGGAREGAAGGEYGLHDSLGGVFKRCDGCGCAVGECGSPRLDLDLADKTPSAFHRNKGTKVLFATNNACRGPPCGDSDPRASHCRGIVPSPSPPQNPKRHGSRVHPPRARDVVLQAGDG